MHLVELKNSFFLKIRPLDKTLDPALGSCDKKKHMEEFLA